MNQQDIFRLLLITLLIANRQLDENDGEDFSYTLNNDLLILAMVLGGFDDGKDCGTTF